VRTLLGKVDLFVWTKRAATEGNATNEHPHENQSGERKVAEELLAMMEEIFH